MPAETLVKVGFERRDKMTERNNRVDVERLKADAARGLNMLHVANRVNGNIDELELKRALAALASLPDEQFQRLLAQQKNGKSSSNREVSQAKETAI